jgi:GT2 family glycosyltransferase/ubiquinone/menaquinone biosynthesis C-methylase UbiE
MLNENLNLPFDLYTRNIIISDLINKIREDNKRLKILDVGGRNGDLTKFLHEDDDLYILDIRNSQFNEKNYFLGNIINAPFKDDIFDVVVSSELFEHIASEHREISLSEMLRISKNFIILGAPFHTEEVAEAEIKANEFFHKLTGNDHQWLSEHIKNGLPSEKKLLDFLKKNAFDHIAIETNNINNWVLMQLFIFYSYKYGIPDENVSKVYRFYNENFLELGDSLRPTYRKIYLIWKKRTLTKVDFKFNNVMNQSKYHMLETLIFETIGQLTESRNAHIQYLEKQIKQIPELNVAIKYKDKEIEHLNETITDIKTSTIWQILSKYQRVVDFILPPATKRRRVYDLGIISIRIIVHEGFGIFLRKLKEKMIGTDIYTPQIPVVETSYDIWIKKNEPTAGELKQYKKQIKNFDFNPRIGIVIWVYNPDLVFIKAAIESVINQVYKNWEIYLNIVSTKEDVKKCLEYYTKKDSRIKIQSIPENRDISKNLNETLPLTTEYIGFLEQNDELAKFALFEIINQLNKDTSIDFIYSDHDIISLDARRFNPCFKPDWSPDTLRSYNYIGDFIVLKRYLLKNVDYLREYLNSPQLYDLILIITEKAKVIHHVSKVLYHKHQQPAFTTSIPLFSKNAGKLRETILSSPTIQIASLDDTNIKISLVILNKDAPEYIIPLIDSLRTSDLNNYYEIIIGDTGTTNKKVLEYYQRISSDIKIIKDIKYHFSSNYNHLITNYAKGEIVGIINNDIILEDTYFLHKIESVFSDNEIGVVGTKLLYKDGRLQHGGVLFFERGRFRGLPYHRLYGKNPDELPESEMQIVPALTGAFMFCRRAEFISFNGFDENYDEEAQDIDLCLKFSRMGKKLVFLNINKIIHIENATRIKGSENWKDRNYFLWKWSSFLDSTVLGSELNRDIWSSKT